MKGEKEDEDDDDEEKEDKLNYKNAHGAGEKWKVR